MVRKIQTDHHIVEADCSKVIMRLFIQIPCLNEEQTLPMVLKKMPTEIPGIDDIQLLVIDDGCSDKTVEVAGSLGVRHFVHHARPMGLARAFRDGVDYALKHGADIVVNTDGDNQYPSETIGELVRPIIRHEADIVVARPLPSRSSAGSSVRCSILALGWSTRPLVHIFRTRPVASVPTPKIPYSN